MGDYPDCATMATVMQEGFKDIGRLITTAKSYGFCLSKAKIVQLDRRQAEEIYQYHKDEDYFEGLILCLVTTPILVMELLRKKNAVAEWLQLVRYYRDWEMFGTKMAVGSPTRKAAERVRYAKTDARCF